MKKYSLNSSLLLLFLTLGLLVGCKSSTELPKLPGLKGYSPAISEHVKLIHAKALGNATNHKAVGEMAMTLHSNFFYSEAEEWYSAARKLDSTEWLWYYYPALIKEELGDVKAAIENLKKVVELNPQVANAWFKLGSSYLKQNDFPDAEEAFGKVRQSAAFTFAPELPAKGAFPLSAYAGVNLARVFIAQEKYDLAEDELQQLVNDYPRFGSAYRLLGEVYKLRGETETSTKFIIRAGDFENYIPPSDPMFNSLLLNTRDSNFILKQIDIAIQSENFEWADLLCDYILKYDAQEIDAIAKSIQLKLVKNEADGLSEKVQLFFEHYRDNDEKLLEVAEAFYRWNQPQHAVKYLKQVHNVNPKAIEAHVLYLKILVQEKADEHAVAHCKMALEISPENSELRTEYGRILLLQGKVSEAKEQLSLAIQSDSENEVPFIMLGIMAQNKGDVNAALRSYRKSIEINPLNINAVTRLGNYLLTLKRWNEAARVYQEALAASPNSINLLERNAWILSTIPNRQIRNGEKALGLAKRLTFIRKEHPRQDIECGITLAAVYAELREFDRAIGVLQILIKRAFSTKQSAYVPRIQSMIKQFAANKPLRM